LIVEPSRLLSFGQGHLEFKTVLHDLRRCVEPALRRFHIARQALHLAQRTVVLEQQRLAAQNLLQGLENEGFEPLHSGSPDLRHAGRAVAVDHQPR
jgi:hypothetical protein